MRRTLLYFALLLFLPLCAAQAQDKGDRPLITVSGQAEINVTPDMAIFNLRVVMLDKDLARAKALNDERVKKVLALAKDYQLAPGDVQTNYISIETSYSEVTETKPSVFLGYEVAKSIVLTLRDMNRIEALLSDVVKAGVNRVGGIEFRTTQLRKYRDQARQMAIRAAQEKAIALTKEIGQTIGKAYSITEESFERSGGSNNFVQNSISSEGGDNSQSEGTIAIGQIPVSARVTVRFELK